MSRLPAATVAAALAATVMLDIDAAVWTGSWWVLAASFALAACAVLVVVARRRLPARRLQQAGLAIGICSLLLTGASWSANIDGSPSTWGLTEAVALAVTLRVSATAWCRTRDTATPIALVAALVAAPWRSPDAGALTFSLLAALVAVTVLTTALLRRAEHQRAAQELLAVRNHERRDIARDLHDDVAHHVTGIIVAAQAATVVAARDPVAASAALRSIEQAGLAALTSMRSLVSVLRTAEHDADGPDTQDSASRQAARWPEELHELVARFGRSTGLNSTVDAGVGQLPAPHRQAVLRTTQEALTNIQRHARHPTRVDVTVVRDAGLVTLTITDDGGPGRAATGPLSRSGGGHGLVGVGERAAALGGTVEAGGHPSGGWQVQATFPLPAERDRR